MSDKYWQTSYRVFLGDEDQYCLSIKDGKVVISDPNPQDLNQFWIKDYSSGEKDTDGYQAFAMFNKGTGQALQHRGGGGNYTQPTKLIQYNPNETDLSTLFTEASVSGSKYVQIRLQNTINWHLYVQWGDTNSDSQVRQGVVDHVPSAKWTMVQDQEPSWRVLLKTNKTEPSYCLSIRNGKVVVLESDPFDVNQYWIRDNRFSSYTDEDGFPAFALFNRGSHQALRHAGGGDDHKQPTKLITYNMLSELDKSTLFTEGTNDRDGFRSIKLQNDANWFLYVKWGATPEENEVRQSVKEYEEAALWKLELISANASSKHAW